MDQWSGSGHLQGEAGEALATPTTTSPSVFLAGHLHLALCLCLSLLSLSSACLSHCHYSRLPTQLYLCVVADGNDSNPIRQSHGVANEGEGIAWRALPEELTLLHFVVY